MPIPQQYLDANRFTDSYEWHEPIKTQVGSGGEISVQNLETGKWEPARVVWQFDPTVGYNKQILLPDSVARQFAPDAEWASQRSGTSGLVDKAGDFMNEHGGTVVAAIAALNGMPMPWSSGAGAGGFDPTAVDAFGTGGSEFLGVDAAAGAGSAGAGAAGAGATGGSGMDWFDDPFGGLDGFAGSDPSWGSSWKGSIDNPGLFDPSTPGFEMFNIPPGIDPSWGESWRGSADNPGLFDPSTPGFEKFVPAAGLTLSKLAQGASVANAGLSLSKMLGLTGDAATAVDALGRAIPGLLGAYAASKQADATKDLAAREDARIREFMAYGAPSRDRYEASFAPGFDIGKDPALQGAMDTTSDTLLRRLSANGGNPFGNPGGLIEANKSVLDSVALPYLQNYRKQNASTGGYGAFNTTAAGGGNSNALNLAGVGSDTNVWNALGSSASSVFNPPSSLEELLKKFKGSNLFGVA